jgi:hypothetical protein
MAMKVTRLSKSNNNPVGMIVSSMLTEVQFQILNGPAWILADGRNITGSVYQTVTGNSIVPDLRSMVLRGKNNGRVDGNENPDGDVSLGTFQNQGLGSHKHGSGIGSDGAHLDPYGFKPGAPVGSFRYSGLTSGAKPMPWTETVGDNETRMRNISVNHFIKINP